LVRVSITPPCERDLEEAADRLLSEAPRDPERPAYTERHLARRVRLVTPIEAVAETIAPPVQSLCEELTFLLSVSRVDQDSRRCLQLWIDGWSQLEIAEAIGTSQQRVSQRIRIALEACYDATPISFGKFSEHTVYRPPRHGDRRAGFRRCVRCGETLDSPHGRWCPACRMACLGLRSARTALRFGHATPNTAGNMTQLPDPADGEDP
jgi:hypothetical protein